MVSRAPNSEGNVLDLGDPSSCASDDAGGEYVVACTRGEDVVRYPACDECCDNGGRMSLGLLARQVRIGRSRKNLNTTQDKATTAMVDGKWSNSV